MFIKESYVYQLPVDCRAENPPGFKRRWVTCECGIGRRGDYCEDKYGDELNLIRFFKVDGVQTCEVCLDRIAHDIGVALNET